jgi:hypothetical protein
LGPVEYTKKRVVCQQKSTTKYGRDLLISSGAAPARHQACEAKSRPSQEGVYSIHGAKAYGFISVEFREESSRKRWMC